MDMTREQALDAAGVIIDMDIDWWDKSPWAEAVKIRWDELIRYALRQTNTPPDPDWTLESIAHLEGAPKNSE